MDGEFLTKRAYIDCDQPATLSLQTLSGKSPQQAGLCQHRLVNPERCGLGGGVVADSCPLCDGTFH